MKYRFYYDPDDSFSADVLLPVLADQADRAKREFEEISLESQPPAGSARAREDGVEQLPTLTYRQGEVVEAYEGHDAIITCADDEPLDTLAIEEGYLSPDGKEWKIDV
jgi:hypothetical protein